MQTTLLKSTSGAYFTIIDSLGNKGVFPTNSAYIPLTPQWPGTVTLNLVNHGQQLLLNKLPGDIINGDTSLPFTDLASVITYIDTNFFREASGSGGGGTWGSITGTLSAQTDLATALGLKADKSGNLTQFASTTSAQLASVIGDETGSGLLVFNNSPVFITPNLGTPSALVGTNISGTAAGLSIGGNAATATNGVVTTGSYANPAWITAIPYSILSGAVPTWNQNTTGNAATVTTNANLTGPVTSTGNATAIANGAITNAMLANAAVANLSGTNTGDQTITLTGEATGSGTGSFAVTLTNSAVIGKVFTGLSTATSSTVLATDTIVVGVGKLQAQINTGMTFGAIFTGAGTAGSPWGIATDTTATATSTNLITSGAVYTGLLAKFPYLTPTSVKVSSSTAAANDFVLCNANGTTTINFPITPADKTVFAIKMVVQSGSNTIPFQTTDGSTINTPTGPTSGTLSLLNQGVVFEYAVATNVWYVICDDLPLSQLDLRYVAQTRTINGKALSSNITLGLASNDFVNQGTTTTVLIGNAAGNPSFGAVNLATMITGNLPVANLNSGTSASSSTFWRGDGTWAAAGTTYTISTGLTNTSGTLTNDVLTGKSGGQTWIGGTGTTDTVTISATSGAGSGGATAMSFKPISSGSAAMTIAYNGSVNFNNGIALNNPSGQIFLNGNIIIQGKNDINTYLNPVGTAGNIIFRNFADTVSNITFGNTGNIIARGTISSGIAGTIIGGYLVGGNTSGTVSILPQAAAGTYNFNLPITAGTAGQVLTSQGGGATAMTWTNILSYSHTIFTPTTGGTVSLVNNQYNIINPAGALVALTVNLPSSPVNGDVVYIKFTQTISTVTYGNGTVVDGITAPTAGGLTILVYDSGTTSWY